MRGLFYGLLLWIASVVPAVAQETSWYAGLPISQVSFEAPEGGLPPENLEPLLRMQQGDLLSALRVRQDLAMLYGTGFFSEVEAHARPWVGFDEQGEPRSEVWLIYRVIAATTLGDWAFEGNESIPSRELALAGGIARGDRFLQEEDSPELIARLKAAYASRGYPAASIALRFESLDEGVVRLVVEVEEGPPRILEQLEIAESPAFSKWRMRRILTSEGLKIGEPFTPESLEKSREALERAHRKEGWLEARINAVPGAKNVRQVFFLIEAGPRVEFISQIEDMDSVALQEALGVRLEDRLRASDLEDGRERLEERLRAEGHAEAVVRLDVREENQRKQITVRAELGPEYRLETLEFDGATLLPTSFLRDAAREASPEGIGRGVVTEDAVEDAREELVNLYEARGYLQVHIQAFLEVLERNETAVTHLLRFRIDEGPLAKLSHLEFKGVVPELVVEAEGIREDMLGHVLDHNALEESVGLLVEEHRERGHLDARARIRLRLEKGGEEAHVQVDLDAGPQQILRYVLVRGNQKTSRRLIEESIAVRVGQPIAPSLLAESRRQLYDLGIFASVDLALEGDDDRAKDLVVLVREKAGTALEVGGGVATDLGVRAFSRLVRRNILGVGHRLSVLGELGLGYEGEAWRLDTSSPEWRAALRYDAPRFPSPSVAAHVDLLVNEREQEPTYRLGRSGGAFGVQIGGVEQGFQLSFGYRVFGHWLHDVDPGALVIGDPWIDVLGVTDVDGIPGALPGGPRWESGPTLLAIWDGRDDRFNPTEGSLSSLQLDLTDPGVAEQITLRAEGKLQRVQPLGPVRLQFAASGGLGWAQGRSSTLALEQRFRMGGANSLRGFGLDTVGPKNRVAISDLPWPSELAPVVDELYRDKPVRWVPTGGDSMLRVSMEVWTPLETLRIPAPGTSLVAFVDAGNVFFTDPTILATSDLVDPEPFLRVGSGVGLRLVTPVGPVQIDWGFNPAYYMTSWAQERGEEPWRFHLSLGSL